jgi:hypothetical protein
MERSYFSYKDIIIYLDAPIRALFEVETDHGLRFPITKNIGGIDVPIIEDVIKAEEDKIISMGFPCIKNKKQAFAPIIASFLQYSLIQRSNQQLQVPYSQITQSYHDALAFLVANKDMCKDISQKTNSFIKSKSRFNISTGF